MKWCAEKEIDAELRTLERAGYRVTKAAHVKVIAPNGRTVTLSGTPSDHRAVRNIKADLRRLRAAQEEHGKPA